MSALSASRARLCEDFQPSAPRARGSLRFRLPRASPPSWFYDLKSPVSFAREEWRERKRDGTGRDGASGVVRVRVCPTLSPIVREDTHVREREVFPSEEILFCEILSTSRGLALKITASGG